MGLDISVYRGPLKYLHEGQMTADDDDGHFVTRLYQAPCFIDRSDGLAAGVYETGGIGHGFRAGSYGGYNAWRDDLAALVGVKCDDVWHGRAVAPAFQELINFSDAEGFIGPTTSAKLAKDFADWAERAGVTERDVDQSDVYTWRSRWNLWRRAFELAAETHGVVKFH